METFARRADFRSPAIRLSGHHPRPDIDYPNVIARAAWYQPASCHLFLFMEWRHEGGS